MYLPSLGNSLNEKTKLLLMWEENLKIFDEAVSKCPRFERKGKTVPYTSANGYMFSILNKSGELGIRFSKEVQKKYIKEFESDLFRSYNSIMHGYVLIPQAILSDHNKLINLLNESFDYVMTLEPK